jgi:hypothetical protein
MRAVEGEVTMRRFSIRSLMAFVVAVAVAALRNADDYWAGCMLLSTSLFIGVAALRAVYHADPGASAPVREASDGDASVVIC